METVRLSGGTVEPEQLVTIFLISGDVSVTSDADSRWEYTLTEGQHNAYIQGVDLTIRIESEGQNRYVRYPNVNEPRLLPQDGTELEGGSQLFTGFPLVDDWKYRFDVDGVNGEFTSSNTFNATNLPLTGRGVPVNLRINDENGNSVAVITNEYVSANAGGTQYTVLPANGETLTSSIQEFTITPKTEGVRCRVNVDGATGQYGSNNVIRSGVPVNGEPFSVEFEIDPQDGSPVIIINRTYIAFSSESNGSYSMLDIARAESTAYASSDEAGNNRIDNYTLGETAYIWMELVDTDGVHINDQDLPFGIRFGDITLGSEGFDRREGTYSVYEYNVPSSNPNNTTPVFTAGVFTDAGQTEANALIAEFTLPIGVQTSTGYQPFDVQRAIDSAVFRNSTGGIIAEYTPGEAASVSIEFTDTDGVDHVNDVTGHSGVRRGTINLGARGGLDINGLVSTYEIDPPSSNNEVQDLVLTIGVYLDDSQSDSNALLANIALPLAEKIVDDTVLQNQLILPSNRSVFDRDDWADLVAPQSSIFWEDSGDAFASVKTIAGEKALCARLVGDSGGSSRIGAGFRVPPAQVYTLTQRAYLDANFDWGGTNEGGKLGFGLAGGSRPSGGNATSTGFNQSGFSFRWMWREDGEIDMYTYDADTRGFGTENYTGAFMPRGEWFEITMEVIMSSGKGASDGRGRAWLNGNLIYDGNHRWYGASSENPVQVDAIQHFTFHGGGDATWGPQNGKVNEACFNSVSYQNEALD